MLNKMFGLFLLILALTTPVYANKDYNQNNVPEDLPENFAKRYERFVESKELKPMKPLIKELEKINKRYEKSIKELDKLIKELEKSDRSDAKQRLLDATNKRSVQISARETEKAPMLVRLNQLIKEFWLSKDSDPFTPENDFKDVIDERINYIANESFLGDVATRGVFFRNNGGFRGDMAWGFFIHGEPDVLSVMGSGETF